MTTALRRPRGFTWAKYFNGTEPKEVESIHRHMVPRYSHGPLIECHKKYVSIKAPHTTGRVTDDCPPKLHDLECQFGNALRNDGWEAAKKIYQKIKDFNRP